MILSKASSLSRGPLISSELAWKVNLSRCLPHLQLRLKTKGHDHLNAQWLSRRTISSSQPAKISMKLRSPRSICSQLAKHSRAMLHYVPPDSPLATCLPHLTHPRLKPKSIPLLNGHRVNFNKVLSQKKLYFKTRNCHILGLMSFQLFTIGRGSQSQTKPTKSSLSISIFTESTRSSHPLIFRIISQ